jgi:4-hydroxybenzoate polyprenyltransferase
MTSYGILNSFNNNLNHTNLNLVYITSRLIFISSIYIELLLDIKDSKGDKENNIITFANYFGERKTVTCLILIYAINLFQESYIFYNLKKYKLLLGYVLSNLLFLKNLFVLKYNKITNENILKAVNQTTLSLLIFLLSIIFN